MKRRRIVKALLWISLATGIIAAAVVTNSDSSCPEYRTEKVTRGDIANVVEANGTLNPEQVVTVGSQVSGQVSKLYVHLNDHVTKGQLLAEIDPTLLLEQIKQDRTSLETARSNYKQAGRDLNRTRMLLAKDYVAKVDLEHAQQAYLIAKNSYDSASTVMERDEANLNYTKITAPIEGVIISKDIDLGQTLAASFQSPNLFKIAADLTRMKIDASIPEAFISTIKSGMVATFTVDAFPGRTFDATISTVNLNPSTQSGIVSYSVAMTVNNPNLQLLPGMTAYVNIILSKKSNVLRVPAAALHFVPPTPHISGWHRLFGHGAALVFPINNDGKTVYILRHNMVTPVAVKTSASDDNYVEVSGEGIAEGDMVIVGIQSKKG